MKTNMQLVEEFLNRLYGSNKSKQTIINYKADLKRYLEFLDGQSVVDVDLQKLEEYTVYLRNATYGDDKHYSDSTIARRVSSVRSFYNYLRVRGIVEKDPTQDLEMPTQTQGFEPSFIEEDMIRKLVNSTKGETHEVRDRLILSIFVTTGMRLSELQGLNKEDIDGTVIQILKGKGNKNRRAYISDKLADEIQKYIEEQGTQDRSPLFLSQKNSRLSVRAIQKTVKKYINKIGLDTDKFSTHSLRHSFASTMLQKGVNIVAIQESLGHSSLETTQKYAHTLDSTRQKAADLMADMI